MTTHQFQDYVYPDGIQVLGWLVEMFPLALPLAVALYTVFNRILNKDYEGAAFIRSIQYCGAVQRKDQNSSNKLFKLLLQVSLTVYITQGV